MATNSFAIVALLVAGAFASRASAQTAIPINIESTPPGATVYVDSTTGGAIGTTPLRSARVPRGSHTLIFQLASHEEARLPVNVSRRRETFRVVLNPLGTIVVSAASDNANGAAVRIDGQSVGNVPYRQTVTPGRHLVQVGREGFVTFTQWVELAGGQVHTVPVLLEREAPSTGSILVASDESGIPVFVDGQAQGTTPTVVENVTAGEHVVELRPPGRDARRETAHVTAGQRANVNITLRAAAAPTGRLRVIANVPGAVISLDGEALGEAPVSADTVSPGEHILEATARGYQSVQQPVTIESGQQRVVSLRLERDQREAGGIIVRSNIGSAVITVDGEQRGNPPVVVPTPPAGTHAIVVTAEGYEDFRTTCETGPGHECEIEAQLRPRGTPVHVVANVPDAELFVDGESRGPVPYEGTIPVGNHRIEVRAEGHHPHVEQVNLIASSTPREFNVHLAAEGEMSEEERQATREEQEAARAGATTHSAAVLPPDSAVLDLSLGWPYLGEASLNVAILDWLEGGFAVRSFGRLTDFELRAGIGFRPVQQVSFGFQARFGGGIGPDGSHTEDELYEEACLEREMPTSPEGSSGRPCPFTDTNGDGMPGPALPGTERVELQSHSTNSVFLTLEALGSLHFSDAGAFTLWLGVDFISDSYHYAGRNSDCLVHSQFGKEFITELYTDPTMGGSPSTANMACLEGLTGDEVGNALANLPGARQDLARARLGGALDLVLSRNWNIWALLEGVLAGDKRRILGDILGTNAVDFQLYFRLGLSYKF